MALVLVSIESMDGGRGGGVATFDVAACGVDFDDDFVRAGGGEWDCVEGCVEGGGGVDDGFLHFVGFVG